MPSRQDVINYITQSALRRGIDPNTALRVFRGESGFNPNAKLVTPREASYGVTQLNIKNGLGVDALKRGIDPRDPNQWQQTIDFSLDEVRRGGWTPWSAAKKAGVGRWTGVDGKSPISAPTFSRPAKSIKMGDEPNLANLTPPSDKGRPANPADRAETQILRQLAPTEASNMARPSVKDAIRKSMDELGIRDKIMVAGFVPPGLTRGSAKTRAAANAQVDPRSMPIERDIGADSGPYNRNAPGTRGMEGSYADYVRKQHEEMAKGQGAQLPPGVKSATDPSGAVDPRTGTAVAPYDPNLAAQNDPARQALISARIRGSARQGGQPPPPPNTVGAAPGAIPNGPKAAAATAAVAAGVSAGQEDKDPAVAAVEQKMQVPTANVDPGVAAYERQLNLPPGTLTNPNTGVQQMATPIIQKALPVINEVMKDPQSKQAVQVLTRRMAQVQAQQADMQNDPTFYQQQAARGQAPGAMQDDRAMERAVMMDNQRMMQQRGAPSARGMPQQRMPQPPRPPQSIPGNVRVRSTPPEVRNATEEQIIQQIPPGAEKGDVPPPTRPMTAGQAYPYGMTPPPGAYDATGGIPQGVPASGQMPMDPVMQQLMQFFTQGGGVSNGP